MSTREVSAKWLAMEMNFSSWRNIIDDGGEFASDFEAMLCIEQTYSVSWWIGISNVIFGFEVHLMITHRFYAVLTILLFFPSKVKEKN